MSVRIPTALIAVAALALGAAACTQNETAEAKQDAAVAGDKAEVAAAQAGDRAGEVAAQAGEIAESGAMKAAQAVEKGAGKVADHLEANQAEAAAEGKPGAVNPNTDQRVPAPAEH
ncbi:hypothetical protein [Brevundimonas goettingensis]|uniref:50S ribosomal protein L7/L12 domain protein n=1 Tax=Brevundimonas goettingensis TaxID=2774190 RepID=A0A975C0E6_9CAUL|nr:hypothetical protein [Brevundimonas goettingensis]QTC90557.1 hypothetical protein IFJ75_14960 [Brevundimonas goettingensis]